MAVDIEGNLKRYLGDRQPTARYASFDYCFNYFQEHREAGRTAELTVSPKLEISCLQLGFCLASWGMLRGSSVLLQRSSKHLQASLGGSLLNHPTFGSSS